VKVLFVNDQVQTLNALKRMLDAADVEWDAEFSSEPDEALRMLSKDNYIAIVTDMRMSGMDGAKFLLKVSEEYPSLVRIVLSDQTDRSTVLRAVEPMHYFLSRPCQASELTSTISRACAMRETLQYEGLRQTINTLPGLPSLPTVYLEVSEIIKGDQFSLSDVGAVIEKDIAMTAKVLQLVNSAAFGLSQPVRSTSQAASILGVETLKALILTTSVFQELEGAAECGFSLTELMEHSHKVAMLAKKICQLERLEPDQEEEAFTAGMLHGIGKLLLATSNPQAFAEARRVADSEGISDFEAERRAFGADHAAAGAYLLDLWGLPQSIVEIVALHHRPDVEVGGEFTCLTAVWAANLLCQGAPDEQFESHLSNVENATSLDLWREVGATAVCRKVAEAKA
jgi:putative nucleotidyltransferase with HDIG domain